MQLKRLIINGFKSFADKTEIDFVSGLTGIVGPNGSGKSNITEAIRWALGEQSAKSLRGERMGDVIFAGTDTRPALNRAAVTMTFDNHDGYLKNQPDEVSVTRRLYRDGTSEFLLNGQDVRLKDIVDLFMDSGLGRESFSFISQGRVEAIFNSKPEERRGIIEEAAGVYKYKQQKTKAERELANNDDNLARINDIIVELKHQVEPLREQASLAKDYQQQSGEYHQIHQTLLALEIEQLATEQEKTQGEAKVTKETIAALTAKVKDLEDQSERLSAVDRQFENQLNQLNDQVLSRSMKLENLSGEANLSSERSANAETTLADLKERLARAQQALTEANQRLKELKTKTTAAAEKEQAIKQELAQQKQANQDPAKLNQQVEVAQNHYIDLLKSQADNKNAQAALQKDQQLAASQNAAHDRRIYELSKHAQDQEAKVTALLTQQQQLQAEVDEQQTAVEQAKTDRDLLQQQRAAQQEAYQDELATYQRSRARYETLSELNDDYAGFYNGVRVVLKHKDQLPGVIGAVAELLEVPTTYQQAFDLALGSNLQAIVTRDEAAAQRAISLLKQQRAGRATFLPAAVMRPRELPSAVLQLVEGAEGFLGTGLQLAQYPADLAHVMANLLGSVLMVDTLPHAIVIANTTHHRYRIVTTAGDILNPGGSLTGGQVKQGRQASPLARSQEARHLKVQLQTLVETLKAKQADLTALTKKENVAQAAWQTASQQAQALTAKLTTITSQHTAQAETLRQAQRQLAAAQQADTAQADLSAKLTELQHQGKKLVQDIAEAQATIENAKAAVAAATASSTQHAATVNALKTKLAVTTNDLQTLNDQQRQWQTQARDAQAQATDLQQRIEHITATAEETAAEKASRTATIANLQTELKQLKADQTKLTQQKAENRGKLSQISARITTTYEQQHQAMATSEQQAVALNRVKLGLDARLNTLAEDYQLTYEAAKEAVTADHAPIPELKSKLKLLKRGIDELGPVNLNAIDQFKEVNERYEFLTKQQDDLLEAKQQLEETMHELDETVKTRFKDMFDQTNSAFEAIFPQMFGGGHAHLSLTNPDDLLATGIEISAQPPGKKLTRLSLLSGGERALTAIVLLFAILKVRPVPFSILDEVEASLDDVNVNRFGEFLRHYASATQFIVITHRHGTMVAANVLYGVTMQESGVSRIMAVSLDQSQKEAIN